MEAQCEIRRDLIVSPQTSTVSPMPNNEASVTRSQPTPTTYADLEIRILDRQAAGYPVELTVAGRQLPRGFLNPAALPLPWVASADPAADGERLMRWLLADPAVKEAWDRANGLDGYCRVRLRIDAAAPELHVVPWELLRRPAGPGMSAHDLAASAKTPFSRYLALPSPPGRQIVDERLRVLVAIADPGNLAKYQLTPIDRATELAALEAAVAGLPVELTELTGPCTLPAIERVLRRGYHVLHFVGHGAYVESAGAALFLVGAANQVQIARAEELAAMLARLVGPDNPLQLVFLGSCQTAVASPADAFRGLAPQLLQAGVPAVLAMQDLVPVLTYRAFAQAFYRQLMQHGAVDLAANQARSAIMTAKLPGASIPVLFSRVPDGKLLAIPGVDESAPAPGQSPYKGLHYFDVADAATFHGREHLTADLVDFLRHNSLLAVVGASGSGKSSLVRAGLVHAFQVGQPLVDDVTPPDGCQCWPVHIITPTSRPLESLAASLTRDSESVTATATLMDDLARDPRSLHFYVRRLLSQPGAGGRLLLVVDQFEELWTLCKDKAQRKAFVDNLLAAACPEAGGCSPVDASTLVALTLRADFYAQCAEFDNLRAALERYQRYIGAMSQEELRRAIETPARRGGWELEPGLVDVLLRDVGDEPGALPLLSHALLETWKRRRGRTLTLAGYAASGRVQSAIAKTADEVFQRRLNAEQQSIARGIFLRLTELGEGAPDTRRRVPLDELVPQDETATSVQAVLKTLADTRLVTTFQDEAEVAHEALIREWPALQTWLAEDREALRVHRRLTEAAREWKQNESDEGYLYRGLPLAQAGEWAEQHAGDLNLLERTFLDASQALRKREVEAREIQRQRELSTAQRLVEEQVHRADEQTRAAASLRRRAILAAGIGAAAIILAVFAGWFSIQSGRNANLAAMREAEAKANQTTAEKQLRRARAGELAASALAEWTKAVPDPSLALLLAREAIEATRGQDHYVVANAARALDNGVRNAPPWQMNLPRHRHASSVFSAAFSPDGKLIVTASVDGTAMVWDVATGAEVHILAGHTAGVNLAVFSHDGKLIVTASDDTTAKVWDVATGAEVHTLAGHTDWVASVVFSPDGKLIVTASGDATAKVWDVVTGAEMHTLVGHTDVVYSAVVSPDGKLIVTASADTTAKVWDGVTGAEVHKLAGHTAEILSAAFSPDGKQIVTASADTTAKVWDVVTSVEVHNLAGHTAETSSASFSPDGKLIVTASVDGTAMVWDGATGAVVHTLAGHTDGVISAAFSPDGKLIVTASVDDTAKVWDVASGAEMHSMVGHANWIFSAVFSPDGKLIVTTGIFAAKVWDVETGAELHTLAGHTDWVASVVFSPDGKLIVTASGDATAKVWDVVTGAEMHTLVGHTDVVYSAVVSPDGKLIVTASADTTAKVWDVGKGVEVHNLASHTGDVNSAVFSPDGKLIVTASGDATAKVWDVATGAVVHTLAGHTDVMNSATFSPDGKLIVTASADTTAKVWDVATGAVVHTLAGHTDVMNSAAFSSDGKLIVTASGDTTAKVWDVGTGAQMHTLTGHKDWVASAVFSLDGKLVVTASWDTVAKVWDVATGAEARTLAGHTGGVHSADFSPDGKLIITASADTTAKVWDGVTGAEVHNLAGHTAETLSAAFSPDGKQIVTASADTTAKVWDVATGAEVHTLIGHTDIVNSAVFSPDGRLIVTASWDTTAKVWEVRTGAVMHTLAGHTDSVSSAVFSPDGKLIVTASADGTAKVWDIVTGAQVHSLTGHTGGLSSARFSPDGKLIVTASADSTAMVWDIVTGAQVHSLTGHTGGLSSARFSPDGKLIVTASADGTAKVWDIVTGAEVHTLIGHGWRVESAEFSPDGKLIVTASADGTAKVWDVATGEEVYTLASTGSSTTSAAFSPDGKIVVITSFDPAPKVWDVETGTELHTLVGHVTWVNMTVFSSDGKLIVTASEDGTAKVWDAVTGAEVYTLAGHTGGVNSAVFSPDGKLVVTASTDTTARTWYSSLDDLLAAAERLIQRDPPLLTPEERWRFGLE
jgi:WD40 repeat protein